MTHRESVGSVRQARYAVFMDPSRRAVVSQMALLAGSWAAPRAWAAGEARESPAEAPLEQQLAALEQRSGGRFGVAFVDTSHTEPLGQRMDERFPMCSTFKLLAVAAVLARVDRKEEGLERRIAFGEADLLEHAPVARARAREGSLSVADLCEASITVSDNTAANLLLGTLGGPSGLTAYVRTLGDAVTRLDRIEPMLNEAIAGDARDTTTPRAMLGDMRALLVGDALSTTSRERLTGWLGASKTGLERLRGGVPPGWRAGDKTGSGNAGTTNDVAILWPPGSKPLLIAAYLTQTAVAPALRNAVFADLARLVTARRRAS